MKQDWSNWFIFLKFIFVSQQAYRSILKHFFLQKKVLKKVKRSDEGTVLSIEQSDIIALIYQKKIGYFWIRFLESLQDFRETGVYRLVPKSFHVIAFHAIGSLMQSIKKAFIFPDEFFIFTFNWLISSID